MKLTGKTMPLSLTMVSAVMIGISNTSVSGLISSPPEAVMLNGVTELFGIKRAFFQIPGPNAESAKFSLSEGQYTNGIRLLSVDFQLESVKINNRGHIQTVHICNTPVVLAAANSLKTDIKSKSITTKPIAGSDKFHSQLPRKRRCSFQCRYHRPPWRWDGGESKRKKSQFRQCNCGRWHFHSRGFRQQFCREQGRREALCLVVRRSAEDRENPDGNRLTCIGRGMASRAAYSLDATWYAPATHR